MYETLTAEYAKRHLKATFMVNLFYLFIFRQWWDFGSDFCKTLPKSKINNENIVHGYDSFVWT